MIPPDQYFRQTVSPCFENGCWAVYHKILKGKAHEGELAAVASYAIDFPMASSPSLTG